MKMDICPKVIAVTSGKGGVGKSTVAINLSLALADAGKKVILFDANLNLAGIDTALGIKPTKTILDLIEGRCLISEVLTPGPKGIKVACASSGVEELMTITATQYYNIIKSFSDISNEIDYLIMDTGPGIDKSVTTFLSAAHEILVVVSDDKSSISQAYSLIKVLNRNHGKYRFKLLSNMVSPAIGYKTYQTLNKLADEFLDVSIEYIGSISYCEFFRKTQASKYLKHKSVFRNKVLNEYSEVAFKIDKLPFRTTPRGNIEFFTELFLSQPREVNVQ